MALTPFNGAINTIQSLSDRPNQSDGLTPAQLKAKFDQIAIDTKDYLNNSLIPEAEEQFATRAELIGIIQDQVPDDTITDAKLSPLAGQIKDRLKQETLNIKRTMTMGGMI